MEKCLVTRLKGTVDNDALPVFGALNFKVSAGDNVAEIIMIGVAGAAVKTSGGCYLTNQEGTQNLGNTATASNTYYLYVKGNGYVSVSNKYSLGYFSCISTDVSVDVNDFAHNGGEFLTASSNITKEGCDIYGDITDIVLNWENLQLANCANLSGSIKKTIDVNGNNLLSLHSYGTQIELDLAWLRNTPNLKTFNAGVKVYGDISALGHTKLSTAYFAAASANVVTGTIEQFVANKIASGQTSGTFNLQWPSTFLNVTYKGTPLPNNDAVTDKTDKCTFTWDSAGNVTWGSK